MKRTTAVGLALAMALLGQTTPGVAQVGAHRGDRSGGWGDRVHASLDGLEGRWIAKRGYTLPPRARGGTGLNAVLPPRLVIDQRRNVVRVGDFKGRVLQEIVVGGWGGGGRNHGGAHRNDTVIGRWSDSKLLTVRNGIRNTRIVQTFSLTNRGRTLVVTTRQDGMGKRHDLEFTTVYQRA